MRIDAIHFGVEYPEIFNFVGSIEDDKRLRHLERAQRHLVLWKTTGNLKALYYYIIRSYEAWYCYRMIIHNYIEEE